MRAVVYDSFEGLLRLTDVPDPAPEPHGVVVRVTATGLCRSDWHGWMGHDDDITALPHIGGHEFAGVVEVVGSQVQRWKRGDRVTVPFVCACGTCPTCDAGQHQVCPNQWQPGFSGWGSFAEYVALPWADVNLVALPEAIPDSAAAALGCRTATAYRAVALVGRCAPGEKVAVIGCGGVGLSAVMTARALGAHVIGLDVSAGALGLARRLGAETTVDASGLTPDEVVAAIAEATDGGAHLALDALGSIDTAHISVACLRRRGRQVQVGLLPPAVVAGRASVPMHLVISRELSILGSHGLAAHDYPDLLDLVADGRIDPQALVTRTIGLAELPAAMAAMGARSDPGVTVVDPGALSPRV